MVQKNMKGVLFGALLGTMVGSLSAVLMPKRQRLLAQMKSQTRGFADKAKSFTDEFYNGMKQWTKPNNEMNPSSFIKGAISGLLLGAGCAAFLTPKTGKQLRNNLTRKYLDVAEKTQEFMDYINDHRGIHAHRAPHLTIKRRPSRTTTKRTKVKVKSA